MANHVRDCDLFGHLEGMSLLHGQDPERDFGSERPGSPELNVRNLDPLPVALYPSGCLFRDWAISALDRTERRWRIAFISHRLAAVEAIVARGLAVAVVKEETFPRSLRYVRHR